MIASVTAYAAARIQFREARQYKDKAERLQKIYDYLGFDTSLD